MKRFLSMGLALTFFLSLPVSAEESLFQKDLKKYQDLFDLNARGDGYVDIRDLSQIYKSMGKRLEPQELREKINLADKNRDQKLNLNEFLIMMAHSKVPGEQRRTPNKTFDLYDWDNDGLVEHLEFKLTRASMGQKLKKRKILDWIAQYDQDGDMRLDEQEFPYEVEIN